MLAKALDFRVSVRLFIGSNCAALLKPERTGDRPTLDDGQESKQSFEHSAKIKLDTTHRTRQKKLFLHGPVLMLKKWCSKDKKLKLSIFNRQQA